jgi:hypothetical protein
VTSEEQPGVALQIKWTDYASKNLNARIAELKKRDQYLDMDARLETIQFLRGVGARASQLLPCLYMQLGASTTAAAPSQSYATRVQASCLDVSSLQSITLGCRAMFDEGRNKMTGKRFANITDTTLASVAEFWAAGSRRPIEDATKALNLLRELFLRCAQPKKLLLHKPSLLERRIGLLKYHADRAAAHITLETFLFHLLDLIHVVAAITVVGAIIVDFDASHYGDRYFDSVDEGGWNAAKASFPLLPGKRLFDGFHIHGQASAYWRIQELDGLDMLLNQLPSALGYWDSRDETT